MSVLLSSTIENKLTQNFSLKNKLTTTITITKQHQQGVVLRLYYEIDIGVITQGVNKIDFLQILVK